MNVQVEHREADHQFIALVDGHRCYLRYVPRDGDVLDLVSTFVHPEVRGRHVGVKLVRAALDHARNESLGVIPTCWFVETVIERYPEYRDLLVAG